MANPLRILLIEQNPSDAELIQVKLTTGGIRGEWLAVQSHADFVRTLEATCPDLILSDYALPDLDGLAALAIARARYPEVLFLFVSGAIGEDLAIEAIKKGATDYVLKNRLDRLVPAVLRALRESAERAERRRTERALQESEERYRTLAQQQAAAAHRKDEFLAMLSHELRNPLASICNGLEILRLSDPAEPEAREARQTIERQVHYLSRLVDDLLSVFGISHGKVALRMERLDLGALARRVARDHESAAADAGLRVVLELAAVPVHVIADPTRLTQVVSQVLHNAIKFTQEGGRITLRLEADLPEGHAVLTVRDTGIGIGRDSLSRVFEDFVQVDPGYDRRRGGLGLGLALVKGLVELHGGRVEAVSAGPGTGVCVTIRLPLAAAPPAAPPPPVNNGSSRRPLRILVVEDNRDAARTLQILLRKYGFEVEVAYTGRAGVQRAHTFRPQVVLCDLGLPEMDGFDVARTLRQDPSTVAARLIAISGFGEEEDRRRAYEAGFNLHLTKPVDPEELEQVLTTQTSLLE